MALDTPIRRAESRRPYSTTVFPPIPSEVIMSLAGFEASTGSLSLGGVIAAGTAGAMLGNSFWYLVARAYGYDRFKKLTQRHGRLLTIHPEEVERYVTVPIEIALSSTPGLKFTRSNTVFALGFIRLQFEYGQDYHFVRQQAINRLKDVTLPSGVQPVISPAGGISEIGRCSRFATLA